MCKHHAAWLLIQTCGTCLSIIILIFIEISSLKLTENQINSDLNHLTEISFHWKPYFKLGKYSMLCYNLFDCKWILCLFHFYQVSVLAEKKNLSVLLGQAYDGKASYLINFTNTWSPNTYWIICDPMTMLLHINE